MIQELEKSLCIVTPAAEAAGIARTTHYNWYHSDNEYRAAVDELHSIALDFAEVALFQKIQSGDTSAIIFLLKCRGKARGYIERQSVDVNMSLDPTKPLNIIFGSE